MKRALCLSSTDNIELKELGLLGTSIFRADDKIQRKEGYWLTEKEGKIAEHIVEIEKIMEKLEKNKEG